jgi:hypothetical protein
VELGLKFGLVGEVAGGDEAGVAGLRELDENWDTKERTVGSEAREG